MKRKSTAIWNGPGKDGRGFLTTASTVLNKTQYSWSSRFEQGVGTNPEELVAAAHAGCFAMKLSFVLGEAGFIPEELLTECTVTLEDGAIRESHLDLKARIPGIGKDVFEKSVQNAKENCPISRSLKTNITLTAELV